jgi:hypothetical protein
MLGKLKAEMARAWSQLTGEPQPTFEETRGADGKRIVVIRDEYMLVAPTGGRALLAPQARTSRGYETLRDPNDQYEARCTSNRRGELRVEITGPRADEVLFTPPGPISRQQ